MPRTVKLTSDLTLTASFKTATTGGGDQGSGGDQGGGTLAERTVSVRFFVWQMCIRDRIRSV